VILDHEERFWLSEAITRDACRCACRWRADHGSGDATRRTPNATSGARDVRASAGRPRDGHDDALLELLHHVYERTNEPAYLPGLEPDLLGEAMVLRVAQPPKAVALPSMRLDQSRVRASG